MKELKTELKRKLKEIFQFENEDLNFGIYRIINYKRKEIEEFIEEKLINEIKKQLKLVSNEETERIREEFEELKQRIKEILGKNAFDNGELKEEFKNTPLGKEYYEKKKQVEEIKISEDLEREIYNHLINFFSRYYDKGDFISKRRYGKNEKYIIPYNGDEVLLYWANKDQYYIKTTEYFRKYTFWDKHKSIKVNFKVTDAEEEKGNIKSQNEKFFVLKEEIFNFDEEKRELDIYFEYRALTSEEKEKYKYGNSVSQDKANEEIIKVLKEKIPQNSLARLIFEKEGDKTLIEKHLYRYTRRNTTDYFIHKDLKGFLERELDFYIKNEFLQLEDLRVLEESGYFDKLRLYLIGVRAFRNIALKIIEFLAQIEDFQKKIWEKKKFVIDTHYVITLDKIKEYAGEEFLESILDEILNSKKQLEEWKELFGIEIKSKQDLIENDTLQGKEWKKLPIDTTYFDEELKWKLLVALSKNNDLEEILNGVLIKSENFQALNLLFNKYREKVKTIYIDPPYNTGKDNFLYKDNYQHSSWITMIKDRLLLSKFFLTNSGIIFVSIDDNEFHRLREVMDFVFGTLNRISDLIWDLGSGTTAGHFARSHEYILVYARNKKNLSNFKYEGEEDLIIERATKRPSIKNPLSKIKFQKGMKIEGVKEIEFKKRIGTKSEPIYIIEGYNGTEKVVFKNGELIHDVVLEAAWAVREQILSWLSGKITYDSKGQLVRRFFFDKNGRLNYEKIRGTINPKTVISKIASTKQGTELIKNLIGGIFTDFPKPLELIYYLVKLNITKKDIILDFFAGSGTTAHAVMKLNKEDGGRRKFILIEMADYFYTVIIPRIKKVAYSFNWKEGTPQDTDGNGVFFKYHTLEQYEDALENIEFKKAQPTLYDLVDYFVKYMFEWETKNSKTFLNIDEIKDPFNYKLKIIENYQQKIINVDLVETFNYLIGLNVSKYKVLQENGRKYVFVFGEKDGKRIVIVWRSIKDIDFEKDKEVIEAGLKGFESDEIYINGEALVKGFRHIEPLFKSLMFEKVE